MLYAITVVFVLFTFLGLGNINYTSVCNWVKIESLLFFDILVVAHGHPSTRPCDNRFWFLSNNLPLYVLKYTTFSCILVLHLTVEKIC